VVVENGHFWVVCRNVSVELLLIEIPLDTVEAVSLEIIVTLENGLVAFQSMRRYDGVGKEFDTSTTFDQEDEQYHLVETCRIRHHLFCNKYIFFSSK
jgi:hypothetical protein